MLPDAQDQFFYNCYTECRAGLIRDAQKASLLMRLYLICRSTVTLFYLPMEPVNLEQILP